MQNCGKCCKLCKVLVVVGAINWGLVGLFGFDLVQALVGSWPMVAKVVYVLIGLAGVMMLVGMVKKGSCKPCSTPPQPGAPM